MNRDNKLRAVVLAGDYGYIRQIETTLKSVIYHNNQIKFYIFNQDIPKEWFKYYKLKLHALGSDLVDIKLLDVPLDKSWYAGKKHINFMTFARYFIPQFVKENDVLYLDSDIVVTADLSSLFNTDISNVYLAASYHVYNIYPSSGFNAGVLYINNKRWKEENLTTRLIQETVEHIHEVTDGDQSILNRVIGQEFVILEDTYNFQIGFDYNGTLLKVANRFFGKLDSLPKILHYLSQDKPWNTYSSGRLREVWWHYQMMDWSKIEEKWISEKREVSAPVYKGELLIITNTHLIEQIEDLIKELPDFEFHIVTFTDMAANLKKLASFDNVFLHPKVIGYILEDMIRDCDIYLDINHGSKDPYFLDLIIKYKKPALSFDNVTATELKNYSNHFVIAQDDADTMIKTIKCLRKEINHD